MSDLIIVLNKQIEELKRSLNHWKREWKMLNAALNMAEDSIKKREDAYVIERDEDRERIKELEAENKLLRERLDKVYCDPYGKP